MSDVTIIARQGAVAAENAANSGESASATELKRVLDICNACRYCEGFCATFQALSRRREVDWQELDYLANLCHGCTACYHACQYAPPHVFSINAPLAFSEQRIASYAQFSWPGFMGKLFQKNGLVMSVATAVVLFLTLLLGSLLVNRDTLLSQQVQPGAFYQVVSHEFLVATAGTVFLFAIFSMAVSAARFGRASKTPQQKVTLRALGQALRSAATMRYLGGGHGEGCNAENESFSNQRRIFHQFTMWGFLLCFAATCTATVYEYFLGRLSPFPFLSLPVLLGTVGGVGLLVGPAGLTWVKLRSDTRPVDTRQYGMDYGFLALLFLVSLTGLALLALRETTAMGVLLLVHLGFVFSLFVTLPYGKFVHGVYRFVALVLFHGEETRTRQ